MHRTASSGTKSVFPAAATFVSEKIQCIMCRVLRNSVIRRIFNKNSERCGGYSMRNLVGDEQSSESEIY